MHVVSRKIGRSFCDDCRTRPRALDLHGEVRKSKTLGGQLIKCRRGRAANDALLSAGVVTPADALSLDLKRGLPVKYRIFRTNAEMIGRLKFRLVDSFPGS